MERNPKTDAVIAQFTSDPELTEQIYGHISDFQAGKTSLNQIIDQYTSDPEMKAKILANVKRTQIGYQPISLTAFGTPDSTQAQNAAETVSKHKGVVEHIVVSQ